MTVSDKPTSHSHTLLFAGGLGLPQEYGMRL